MKPYRLVKGSLHDRFLKSRAKVQIFGGGFANGKTAAVSVKALQIAMAYPGSNGLIARSTYPKLMDTIKKEVLVWCPKKWIKSQNWSTRNELVLTNGSTISFRYVAQTGKGSADQGTSNLLSATYDYAIVDQIDDPEFSEKDFLDLLGRLRGTTRCVSEDETLPRTGPRFIILTLNPTGGWPYKKLVKPIKEKAKGREIEGLLKRADGTLDMELFEGSTYENAHNLPDDYIRSLEQAYVGQMRERFLLGRWGAFEGLVYPQFAHDIHVVSHEQMFARYNELCAEGVTPLVLEGYDHGIAAPSCYIYAFIDNRGNVSLLDGFYEKELPVEEAATRIRLLRKRYHAHRMDHRFGSPLIYADPAIFRRNAVGETVAGLYEHFGVTMIKGNNDITLGIAKVQSYLAVQAARWHPYKRVWGAPRLYVSEALHWWIDEVTTYLWKRDKDDSFSDTPRDVNDHAMDTTKYMLTGTPSFAKPQGAIVRVPEKWRRWNEAPEAMIDARRVRYG